MFLKSQKSENIKWYLLLTAPAIVIYLAVITVPILYSLSISFTQYSGFGTPRFIGIDNYLELFSKQAFRHSIRNNIGIVAISLFGQIPLGFLLAYILFRGLVRGGGFFRGMIFLPNIIAPIVVGLLFATFFAPTGVIAYFIQRLTGNPLFELLLYNNPKSAIVPILIVLLWLYTGLYLIIFLANLQKIPQEQIEAAFIDGAGEGQVLKFIILPSLVRTFVTSAIYAISGSLKSFDIIWAMTEGGPSYYTEVLAIHTYKSTFGHYLYGYGSAASIIIVLISVGLICLLNFFAGIFIRRFE